MKKYYYIYIILIQYDPNTSRPVCQYTVGGTTVEFDGVPFSIGEKRAMDCQYYGYQCYKQKQTASSLATYEEDGV